MIAPELVRRFKGDLGRVWPEGAGNGARLGVAVSGGPDSLALLLMAAEALPGRTAVATVDHGLRASSAAEADMVAQVCRARGIAHATLRVTLAGGNMQAEARAARYDVLAEWAKAEGLAAVATGHQADDQAETLLMRLNRGSGLAGLAGVRPRVYMPNRLMVVRPLLDWRKAELQAVCERCGLTPARDPGNMDSQFDRVAMRQFLAGNPLLDPQALARSAAHLAEAEEALEEWLKLCWEQDVSDRPDGLHYRPRGTRHVRLKLLERAIARLGGCPRGSALAALLDRLEAGEGGNIAGMQVTPVDEGWLLSPEQPRRS